MASNYDYIRQENIRKYGEEPDALFELVSEQLYGDRAHFLFELLQNAEDVAATKVQFDLYPHCLEFWHDGTKFSEENVVKICSVRPSNDLTKIGKFGIGFKSVYAHTSAPEIHSGDEHFRIEQYVRPFPITPRDLNSWTTRFVFPFNSEKITPEKITSQQSFAQIGSRLQKLDARTLLFLRHITEIRWSIEHGESGVYLRDRTEIQTGCRRVTVIGHGNGQEQEEEWMVFSKPIQIPNKEEFVNVEVAYLVQKDEKSGKSVIKKVDESNLVVFFPTEKPTNLGFLIQGPYRTIPARNSISPEDKWNQHLIEKTADLVAETLPALREMGLLSVDVLAAMPIEHSNFRPGSMFRPIFDRVREVLRNMQLLPTHDGVYADAKHVKLARGSELLDLFTPQQLGELLGASEPIYWLNGEITETNRETSNLHLYLVGKKARYSWEETIEPLIGELEIAPATLIGKLSVGFLQKQDDAWMARLYGYLIQQKTTLWGILRDRPFLRLEDGSHVKPFRSDDMPTAYLPPTGETEFPIVKREIAADPKAQEFLRNFGIREPDIADEVQEKVLPRYANGDVSAITDDQHMQDIEKILRAFQVDSEDQKRRLRTRLLTTSFLRAVNPLGIKQYQTPTSVYLRCHELEIYFSGNPEAWFLDDDAVSPELCSFLGITDQVRITCKKPDGRGYISIRNDFGWHERTYGYDPNCVIEGLEYALSNPTLERSAHVWNVILQPNAQHIMGMVETDTRQGFPSPKRKWDVSRFGRLARETAWLPNRDEQFLKPSELSPDDLPDVFRRDERLAKQLEMKATSIAALAKEKDIEVTKLETIIDLIKSRPQDVEQFLTSMKESAQITEEEQSGDEFDYADGLELAFSKPRSGVIEDIEVTGSGQITDPERRRQKTEADIQLSILGEPPYEERFTRVPMKQWEEKNHETRNFLREQYQGKCQICGSSFQKRNGEPYFEGLYLAKRTSARWIDRPGNVWCLCPTCCAKFQFGTVEKPFGDIKDQVMAFRTIREGGNGSPALQFTLCGEEVSVRYTEKHMLDLQEMLLKASLRAVE